MTAPRRAVRTGIVCSAGGGSFFSAVSMLEEAGVAAPGDFMVLTDRECGAEDGARVARVPHLRIEDHDARSFSRRAAHALREHGCGQALLLFSRLVTEELFGTVPTMNIHPSLLPAFPGMGALRQATDARSPMQGATLHVVTAACDAGPLVAQVVSPTSPGTGLGERRRLAWIHQTYLVLLATELVARGSFTVDATLSRIDWLDAPRRTASASPALPDQALVDAFLRFQRSLGIEAIVP